VAPNQKRRSHWERLSFVGCDYALVVTLIASGPFCPSRAS
jgi:hypothetical protein